MLDKIKFVGAVLIDLSKGFDTINHNLLIAKLEAYRLSQSVPSYILSYLKMSLYVFRERCRKPSATILRGGP